MPSAELKSKVSSMRVELIKLRGAGANGANAKSVGQIKKSKKLVARMIQQLHTRGEKIDG
jgi:ribosomal protein L29